jgi:hypothetical protein
VVASMNQVLLYLGQAVTISLKQSENFSRVS